MLSLIAILCVASWVVVAVEPALPYGNTISLYRYRVAFMEPALTKVVCESNDQPLVLWIGAIPAGIDDGTYLSPFMEIIPDQNMSNLCGNCSIADAPPSQETGYSGWGTLPITYGSCNEGFGAYTWNVTYGASLDTRGIPASRCYYEAVYATQTWWLITLSSDVVTELFLQEGVKYEVWCQSLACRVYGGNSARPPGGAGELVSVQTLTGTTPVVGFNHTTLRCAFGEDDVLSCSSTFTEYQVDPGFNSSIPLCSYHPGGYTPEQAKLLMSNMNANNSCASRTLDPQIYVPGMTSWLDIDGGFDTGEAGWALPFINDKCLTVGYTRNSALVRWGYSPSSILPYAGVSAVAASTLQPDGCMPRGDGDLTPVMTGNDRVTAVKGTSSYLKDRITATCLLDPWTNPYYRVVGPFRGSLAETDAMCAVEASVWGMPEWAVKALIIEAAVLTLIGAFLTIRWLAG